MATWVFPAGDPDVRRAVAIHRLTDAPAPRSWSIDVNRSRVSVGDTALLWQSGADEPWRPGIWAAGVVYRYDHISRPHWRGPDFPATPYADLELVWVPIIDRAQIQRAPEMRQSVLASKRQFQMRSPTLLRDGEADWVSAQLPRWATRWLEEARATPIGST